MEAIEFFDKNLTVDIESRQIFPGELAKAKQLLPDLKEDFGSYISKKSSVGLCIDDGVISSVLVGCKGYYD